VSAERAQGDSKIPKRHSRVRRAVKIVGPWRVGVSLVFGVVATVFVAWWFQTGYHRYVFPDWAHDREYSGACYFADDEYLLSWAGLGTAPGVDRESLVLWRESHRASRGLGVVPADELTEPHPWHRAIARELRTLLEAKNDTTGKGLFIRSTVDVTGLPFRCFYDWRVRVYDASGTAGVAIDRGLWVIGRGSAPSWRAHEVSVGPVWSGLLLNTAIYGAMLYAVISIPPVIVGLRRRLTNRCHPCGYRLDGLTTDACPECGWAIKRKGARSGRDGDT
jgi:hypothetical protein